MSCEFGFSVLDVQDLFVLISQQTSIFFYLHLTDNSISVLAKHDSFRRQKQELYFLPIIVTDNGHPPLSSTNTLTIRVCGCSKDGAVQSCNVEAYVLPIGLSMGALIAILACIVLLLGELLLASIDATVSHLCLLCLFTVCYIFGFFHNFPNFQFRRFRF